MTKHLLVTLTFIVLLSIPACQPGETAQPENFVSGMVLDENLFPIAGAVVRIKATDTHTTTDANGGFVFVNVAGQTILTAWAPGYYIGGGEEAFSPGTSNAKIILKKHADDDNPDYQWVSAFASAGLQGNCENCHSKTKEWAGASAPLPFDEWQQDAHALSAQNPRFLTMYLGQDMNGNQSPVTRYGSSVDYGSFPLRYDPAQPYYGPGLKLDFPNITGNCAACHVPAASINAPYGTDPTRVTGVGKEGIACDFCHKVWNVRLDPTSGLPLPNMPGVLAFEFRRPFEGHQFFAGPLDDVAPGEDTYTPIQTQSQFCAPCHFGSFWNIQIYNSFGEWLDSPYSNDERAKAAGLSSAKTCQDCHMPTGQNDHFARLDKGAAIRDQQKIFSHKMPGAGNIDLLQNAVTVDVDAKLEGGRVVVDVTITNDKTGHHIPTDSPLRQLILLVDATDGDGRPLDYQEGPIIPAWGGEGDPGEGYYAGLPGKGYAKILMELWTEYTPSGAYWNPTGVLSDNRIRAFGSDITTYVFTAPPDNRVVINIQLLYRRAFKKLIVQKNWDVPDIVMFDKILSMP